MYIMYRANYIYNRVFANNQMYLLKEDITTTWEHFFFLVLLVANVIESTISVAENWNYKIVLTVILKGE